MLLLLSKLDAFSSRPYHHGDMEPVRSITTAAEQSAAACPADSPTWQHGMQALLELLFMHNSRPLHKQLLSCIRKLPPAHQHVVGQLVQQLFSREAVAVLLAGTVGQQQQWELLQYAAPLSCPGQHQPQQDEAPAQAQQPLQAQQQAAACAQSVAAAVVSAPASLPAAAVSRGFDLAQAALSLLQERSARSWLQPASPLLLLVTARSIQTTLDPLQAQQGQLGQQQGAEGQQQQQHLTSKVIELVQDAINVLYMLLQHYGEHMRAAAVHAPPETAAAAASAQAAAEAAGGPGALAVAAICEAAQSMLSALHGLLMVREALASAAVVVWAAAVLPAVPPTAAALAFAVGLMPGQVPAGIADIAAGSAADAVGSTGSSTDGVSTRARELLQEWRENSLLEQQLALNGTSLALQLQKAPAVARVCALKGLLAAMPAAALAGNLGLQQQRTGGHDCTVVQVPLQQPALSHPQPDRQQPSSSGSSGTGFIMHCALPFAVDAARAATDAPSKFYAMSLLSSVLEGATKLWSDLQEQLQQAHAATSATAAAGAVTAAAVGDAPGSGSGSGGSAGGVTAGGLVVPWLSGADAEAIMSLLSSHLDEPVAQVGLVLAKGLGLLVLPRVCNCLHCQGWCKASSRCFMRCVRCIHRSATQSHLG